MDNILRHIRQRAAILGYLFLVFLVIVAMQVQERGTRELIDDSLVCMLGNVAGIDDIERPDPEDVERACSRVDETSRVELDSH